MTYRINNELLLWSLGVIQPATPEEIFGFLGLLLDDSGLEEAKKAPESILFNSVPEKTIAKVNSDPKAFSLTTEGNAHLPRQLRHYRDRARLFLLKEARHASVRLSEVARKSSGGASPSTEHSSPMQEGPRPTGPDVGPPACRADVRACWTRIPRQLLVGSEKRPSDISLKYLSFPSVKSIQAANYTEQTFRPRDLSVTDLGLALGVSPQLLTYLTHRATRNYRSFDLGKRGGGKRTISSPKTFLKVVQYFINDYFFHWLPVHDACHSYRAGHSIITNAEPHLGKQYIAKVDVCDFFGSISTQAVKTHLKKSGFGPQLAHTISKLVTLENSLPQGAPTSPAISNSFLFSLDEYMHEICEERSLSYTRYADDITVSGHDRTSINGALSHLRSRLIKYGLKVNDEKTRIVKDGGQKKVTGVIVNEKLQPPRNKRRLIRALFHRARKNPADFRGRIDELQGYISYLNSYPAMRNSRDVKHYREIVDQLLATWRAIH